MTSRALVQANPTAMVYKFKCKAAGDLIMMGPQGDELLKLMGHPPAPRGIIEVAAMPAAIVRLEAAVARSEQGGASAAAAAASEDEASDGEVEVTLRQHAWPMRELLQRALEAKEVIVWGV
jgi:hypothetical protein